MRLRTVVVQIVVIAAVSLSPSFGADASPAIGFQGFGSIKIGMPIWDLLAAFGEQVTIESVEGGCTSVYASAVPEPELIFMVVNGELARIEVRSPAIATISGVSVGDTERAVLTAYAGRVEVSDHEYQEGHYLTIYSTDGKSALVFDTDGTDIRSFRIGRLPEALHVEGCS